MEQKVHIVDEGHWNSMVSLYLEYIRCVGLCCKLLICIFVDLRAKISL